MSYFPVPKNADKTAVRVETELNKTSFGETVTAALTPVIQITAQYGLLDDVLPVAINGSVTTSDSKFVVATNAAINSVAALVSAREAIYRAGQGLQTRFTAVFTEGVEGNTQQAGFVTSESSFSFGYNGTEFGILHARDGNLEYQELTVTTGAGGAETATVTVDGTAYSVSLSAGATDHVAYEIATSLDAQVPGYNFTSNGAVVTALAQLPDFGAGSFAFSSASAVAAWVEINSGTLPTEVWVNKADWNVMPEIDINPTLGNIYQVQIQYLGFGAITFSMEDPKDGVIKVVHKILYANTSTRPSVTNPIFRTGWATRNTTNTSAVTVQGASAAMFVEGVITYDGPTKGLCVTQASVGTTRTNVLTIRNRLAFNGVTNRAELIPRLLALASDTSKTAFFELIVDPEVAFGNSLEFTYVDQATSLMECAENSVAITGGTIAGCFTVKAGSSPILDLNDVIRELDPGSTVAITARVNSGAASDMDVSLIWQEDL